MEHICNPGIEEEGKAEGAMKIQGQPLLHSELQASQD